MASNRCCHVAFDSSDKIKNAANVHAVVITLHNVVAVNNTVGSTLLLGRVTILEFTVSWGKQAVNVTNQN